MAESEPPYVVGSKASKSDYMCFCALQLTIQGATLSDLVDYLSSEEGRKSAIQFILETRDLYDLESEDNQDAYSSDDVLGKSTNGALPDNILSSHSQSRNKKQRYTFSKDLEDRLDRINWSSDFFKYTKLYCFENELEYCFVYFAAQYLQNKRINSQVEAVREAIHEIKICGVTATKHQAAFVGFLFLDDETSLRLMAGDRLKLSLNEKARFLPESRLLDCIWSVTVVGSMPFTPKGAVTVIMKRPYNSKAGTWTEDPRMPLTIGHASMSNNSLAATLTKSPGTECRIEVIASDRSRRHIMSQTKILYEGSEDKPATVYNDRIMSVLLAQKWSDMKLVNIFAALIAKVGTDLEPYMHLQGQQPDETQKAVLTYLTALSNGVGLIIGGPGCGKTWLIGLIFKLIICGGGTLAVGTSTNLAADDLAIVLIGVTKYVQENHSQLLSNRRLYVVRGYSDQGEKDYWTMHAKLYREKTTQLVSREEPEYLLDSALIEDSEQSDIFRYVLRSLHEEKSKPTPGVSDQRFHHPELSSAYYTLEALGLIDGKLPWPEVTACENFLSTRNDMLKYKNGDEVTPESMKSLARGLFEIHCYIVSQAAAVVSTVTMLSSAKYLPHLEAETTHVVIDGAAYIEEVELHPIFAARFQKETCLILAGDPDQLGPQALSDEEKREHAIVVQKEMSLMSRLLQRKFPHKSTYHQHRMHSDMSSLLHNMFNRKRTTNDQSIMHDNRPMDLAFRKLFGASTNSNVLLCDTSKVKLNNNTTEGLYKSRKNDFEAVFIAKILPLALKTHEHCDPPRESTKVAVIAPYANQRTNIQALVSSMKVEKVAHIENVEVLTTELAQGSQFDVVILSMTIGETMGFLEDPERWMVLLSRAKFGLIIIMSINDLVNARGSRFYVRQFVNYCRNKNWLTETDLK